MGAYSGIEKATVAALVDRGLSNQQIGDELGISRTQAGTLKAKFGLVKPQTGAVVLSPELKRAVLNLVAGGLSHRKAAVEAGCSFSQVTRIVKAAERDPEWVKRPAYAAPKRKPQRDTVEFLPAQETCPNGHPWTPETTELWSDMGALMKRPKCKKCAAERSWREQNLRRKRIGLPQIPKEFAA